MSDSQSLSYSENNKICDPNLPNGWTRIELIIFYGSLLKYWFVNILGHGHAYRSPRWKWQLTNPVVSVSLRLEKVIIKCFNV